jgi:hypothetical protein
MEVVTIPFGAYGKAFFEGWLAQQTRSGSSVGVGAAGERGCGTWRYQCQQLTSVGRSALTPRSLLRAPNLALSLVVYSPCDQPNRSDETGFHPILKVATASSSAEM